MSQWVPCTKCGMFVSIGMSKMAAEATCGRCGENDERFYHPHDDIKQGQTVEGKHFKGIVKYIGTETEVEIKESNVYDEGETVHVERAYLRPVDQTTLN